MKLVAETLGVARSNLVEQLKAVHAPRGRYHQQGDEALLSAIRQLTEARPTYGYRRITALLNRARRASGAGLVNHKRVFRLMSQGRLLLLACVERRFNALRVSHQVQWLTDNGSAYTARETLDFATALGLTPCFTPVRSPESNGVSEAFVKTLKRDYARIHPRPDALTVLQQIPEWIEDYNENHPHSGLRTQ